MLIALAAGIIYHTATDSLNVKIDKVETNNVLLSGAEDIAGLYEVVDSSPEGTPEGWYSTLTGDALDLDVYGCLVYGTDSDGGSIGYDTSAGSLREAYSENKE